MTSTFAVKSVAILAILTALAVLASYLMYRRMHRAEVRLRKAQAAAEEAARAAALAAPGGIDPDIVLAILNQGLPPTLDNVYTLTRRREAERRMAEAAGKPAA